MAQHHLKGGRLVDSKRGLTSIATNPMQHLASPHPQKLPTPALAGAAETQRLTGSSMCRVSHVADPAMQHIHTHRRQTMQRLYLLT